MKSRASRRVLDRLLAVILELIALVIAVYIAIRILEWGIIYMTTATEENHEDRD